jgi:hypothetical protein
MTIPHKKLEDKISILSNTNCSILKPKLKRTDLNDQKSIHVIN